MMTVSRLKQCKTSKPYTSPLKVRVCGVGATNKYTTEKGEEKGSTVIGLADSTDFIKAIVYDEKHLKNCREDSCIMIMNYIYKSEATPMVVITNKSRVMMTSNVQVSDETKKEAALIANPPPAECIPIKLAKASPVKSLLSVEGKVISEDMVKTVNVRGSEVRVKSIKIQDGGEEIKVSLWRELSDKSLMGQYVRITNVVVNVYKEEKSLSTTGKTEIQMCQEPSKEFKGQLVGYETGDVAYSIMVEKDDNFTTYTVPITLMCSAFDCGSHQLDATLQESIPVHCEILLNEGEVVSFAVQQH